VDHEQRTSAERGIDRGRRAARPAAGASGGSNRRRPRPGRGNRRTRRRPDRGRAGRGTGVLNTFRAADGYFLIAVIREHQLARLATLVGRPDWVNDPRLADPAAWPTLTVSPSAASSNGVAVAVDGVNIYGYLTNETGIGAIARGFARSLRGMGVPLGFKDLKGSDGGLPDSKMPGCERTLYNVIGFQPPQDVGENAT